MTIEFFVQGYPKPAGSKKAIHHRTTGRIIVMDSAAKAGSEWTKQIKEVAEVCCDIYFIREPLLLALTFYLPRPQYHFNKKGLKPTSPSHHTNAPDSTKLTRRVEDALTGIAWRDDAQIVAQSIQKRYCDAEHPHPGVLIYVTPFDES